MFSNFTKVSLIEIENLPTSPVVYRWWFPEENLQLVSNPFVDINNLEKTTIGSKVFYALYVGIGVNCRQRFNWHIHQKHTSSSVRSGILSTLRQTLSALLGKEMTESEEDVCRILENCYLEWEIFPAYTKEKLEKEETRLIKKGYYPLNIQKNRLVDVNWRKHLITERKKYRK